jgi:hypothetical protein
VPVDPLVNQTREPANLRFGFGVAVEIGGGGQHACHQKRSVDRRQLAVPGAVARIHMQEVIEEAAIADRVSLTALVTVGKETKCLQCVVDRVGPLHPATLDGDWIGR